MTERANRTPRLRVQGIEELLHSDEDPLVRAVAPIGNAADPAAFSAHLAAVYGSKRHSSSPVAAFKATTLRLAVVAYNTPSTTMGLTSSSVPTVLSLASNVHATCSCVTFSRLICVRDEYRMLSGPPPYTGHSTGRSAVRRRGEDWAASVATAARRTASRSRMVFGRV